MGSTADTPRHLDLKKDRGLTIQWPDGSGSYYPIAYLRRLSPSADMRELRKSMQRNPLTVLPTPKGPGGAEVVATHAELVGNYGLKVEFSDGHRTGIYTWEYLRQIDPVRQAPGTPEGSERAPGDDASPHHDPLALGPG